MNEQTPALILQASLAVALAVFAIGAIIQLGRRRAAYLQQQPPMIHSGMVRTHLYHPLDLLWFSVVCVVFSLNVFLKNENISLNALAIFSAIIMQFFFAALTCILVLLPRQVSPVAWLGLRWKNWPWVFLIAPVCVGSVWIFMILLGSTGYQTWIESLGAKSSQETVRILKEAKDPLLLGLMGVTAVFVAPLCEEIVFRGFLYPVAKRFGGRVPAMIFTALFFSTIHGELVGLLPLFVLGVVLSELYENTGSLWAPIAVHFCFNSSTVALQMLARALNLPLDS